MHKSGWNYGQFLNLRKKVPHAESSCLVSRGLELSGMMLKPQQKPAIKCLRRKGILEPGKELSTSILSVWWGK